MWIYSFMVNHLTLGCGPNSRCLCLWRTALLLKTCWRPFCCYIYFFLFFNPAVALYSHFNKTQRIQTAGSLFLPNSHNDSEFNDQMVGNVRKVLAKEGRADDAEFSYLFQRMYFFLGLKLSGFGLISRAQRVRGSPWTRWKLLLSARRKNRATEMTDFPNSIIKLEKANKRCQKAGSI